MTPDSRAFSRRDALRVGVVGAGGLGVHHVRILRDLCGDRFAGFVDENPGRAAEVASQHDVTAFPSLAAMLDEVDAVSIVVPTTAHHAVAAAALDRGKHVFVEKPFTVTLAEADDLLARASAAGVVIQVGHVERFNRAVRAAMPYVDGPRFIESDRLAPFNPRGSDVAVVLDLMIHDLDLVHTLVGMRVDDVQAMGMPVLTPQIDIANARLTFANGAVANITASRVSRERLRKLRIFQRSGYISLDLAAGTGEFFRLRGDFDPMLLARAPRALEEFVERVPLEAPEGEPLVLELTQFLGAIAGRNQVAVTGAEGREALDAALRIVSAIDAAREVMRRSAETPRA
ncbi:MAG: Gfo/Idh/MocA family oxidoreductase [Gemmatimonadota bacterium]|nr:Gfo/Idh/MocA family oxidoreductase [Gemmatimonadota bacterium]MDQ8167455.1 Gfo/Idh/MocA family oxidoreductase [Gemmatimonadota bacterium]MDQ8171969.1 Gfo/Idh/MocA family oxidoreductase [Gemmatimonadota bacterium]